MTKPHSSGNCLATPRIAKTRRKERPSRGVETQKSARDPLWAVLVLWLAAAEANAMCSRQRRWRGREPAI